MHTPNEHTLHSSSSYRAISPPTPAPSPQPDSFHNCSSHFTQEDLHPTHSLLQAFGSLSISNRAKFLNALLPILNLNELTNLSARILPRLKRDFLREMPIEISLHILSFVDDPKTLMRAGMVSRFWRSLVSDEATWKVMCSKRGFNNRPSQPTVPLSLAERMEKERKGRVATYRAGVEERRRRSKKSQLPDTTSSSSFPIPSSHTTTGLGLESSTSFALNHPNLQPSRLPPPPPPPDSSTLTILQPTAQPISVPYLPSSNSRTTTSNNQVAISRRNSFDDLLTSPRLDSSFHPSTQAANSTTSFSYANPNPPHLIQRPSPLSSHPFSLQDPADSSSFKQPHKVINANSPQPGMIAPTNATSPRRSSRPKSMPILGLSFNLTRSISAFPDLNPTTPNQNRPSPINSAHPGSSFMNPTSHQLSRESVEDRWSSSNSQTTSYIPDHPDSALWTPSSVGNHDLPPTSSSIYDDMEYASPRAPFSYKSYFKRAYLTESNWLRGPGELIAMQISQNNDGHEWVVTSLGFDDDWIVVGMATSKIHIFSAHTGEFHKTLTGHELGVWCLALVSKGGIRDPRDPAPEKKNNNKGKNPESKPSEEDEDDAKPCPTPAAPNQDPLKSGVFQNGSSPGPNHNVSPDWVSSTYNPSIDVPSSYTHGITMMRAHGYGMSTWRDRRGSQQTTVQAPPTGSIFPSTSSIVEEDPPPPLQVWSANDSATTAPTNTTTDNSNNDANSFDEALAPPPSFSRIPPAPSSSSSTVLDSSDLRQTNAGTSRSNNTRASIPKTTPLGFDYRRPRRPSSFSSFKTTPNSYSHPHGSYNQNDDYTYRSTSYQNQYGIHGTPGGMGLGAGGPSAGNLQQASACGTARGWGQKESLVVSGGCDRDVRVWDVMTGQCKFTLHGHSSTIRCLKVLDGRPIAVSGSRDSSLRVWDIERGVQKHVLLGHTLSVRAIEVHGNRAVSGSYDTTCRLWDLDTGECLKVLRGHYHQIYAIAFDGVRIASGSMDSTVCIWSAITGELIALLQGHTALVGQVQINGQSNVLVTGGSDGRVVIFSLDSSECIHRLCAHDNSVTCLQFDDRFVVTGGNDGRVKLWDFKTGNFIREIAEPCEAVWRITLRDDKAVLLCKRDGRTVMELISFRPSLD